jgi:hypothetical protein
VRGTISHHLFFCCLFRIEYAVIIQIGKYGWNNHTGWCVPAQRLVWQLWSRTGRVWCFGGCAAYWLIRKWLYLRLGNRWEEAWWVSLYPSWCTAAIRSEHLT